MRSMTTSCPGTLVLHEDGTRECEHGPACGGDLLLHEWTVGCDELGCRCVTEEVVVVLAWAA